MNGPNKRYFTRNLNPFCFELSCNCCDIKKPNTESKFSYCEKLSNIQLKLIELEMASCRLQLACHLGKLCIPSCFLWGAMQLFNAYMWRVYHQNGPYTLIGPDRISSEVFGENELLFLPIVFQNIITIFIDLIQLQRNELAPGSLEYYPHAYISGLFHFNFICLIRKCHKKTDHMSLKKKSHMSQQAKIFSLELGPLAVFQIQSLPLEQQHL